MFLFCLCNYERERTTSVGERFLCTAMQSTWERRKAKAISRANNLAHSGPLSPQALTKHWKANRKLAAAKSNSS